MDKNDGSNLSIFIKRQKRMQTRRRRRKQKKKVSELYFFHLHFAVVQKLNGLLSNAVVLYSGIGDEEEKSVETGPTNVVPDVVAAVFVADNGI